MTAAVDLLGLVPLLSDVAVWGSVILCLIGAILLFGGAVIYVMTSGPDSPHFGAKVILALMGAAALLIPVVAWWTGLRDAGS